MKKRILCLLLTGVLAGTLLTGCKTTGNQETDAGKENSVQEQGGKKESGAADEYTIAANTWIAGAYAMEEITNSEKWLCNQIGAKLDVVNNEATADKVLSQLENQLTNNPDGVLFLGIAASTFAPVVNEINSQGIPFAFDTNFPEEKLIDKCMDMPEFCGGITASPYNMGTVMGKAASEAGHKTAVITAAAIGDYSHDNRISGFTDAFESAGGKILQVSHSSDPSEAVQKTNDLLSANPDVDCIYATGGDWIAACVSIKESRRELNCEIYGTDVDPTILPLVANGDVVAVNGGQLNCGALTLTLLINYLDGHQILDAEGKAPLFDNLSSYIITPENAEGFQKLYDSGENFVGMDNFNKLLYRSNPDVSVDTYNEVLKGFADSVYNRIK